MSPPTPLTPCETDSLQFGGTRKLGSAARLARDDRGKRAAAAFPAHLPLELHARCVRIQLLDGGPRERGAGRVEVVVQRLAHPAAAVRLAGELDLPASAR